MSISVQWNLRRRLSAYLPMWEYQLYRNELYYMLIDDGIDVIRRMKR